MFSREKALMLFSDRLRKANDLYWARARWTKVDLVRYMARSITNTAARNTMANTSVRHNHSRSLAATTSMTSPSSQEPMRFCGKDRMIRSRASTKRRRFPW